MLQRSIALTLSLSLAASLAPAQFSTFPDRSYWKEMWQAPPWSVEIEPVGRLEDYVIDGKLQLSLRSYAELVIANNPDVNLQKLVVYEQQNAIQRSLSPFDPTFTASFNANRSTTPANDLLQGAAVRSVLSQNGRAAYVQTFDTGTEFQTIYSSNRRADNSAFANFNPSVIQTLQVQMTQPLMRNRGRSIQRLPFLIATTRLNQTEAQAMQQVMTLLFQAENAYWDVISQRENLRVRENNVELARAFLDRSRRELELGAISPLDIYQPEQQFAASQVGVTQARYRLQQAEDAVRRWTGADLHPDIRYLPLTLTETAEPPASPPSFDAEATVELALAIRPEVEQRRRALAIDDLSIKQATNALRPDVALNALYSSTGRGGNFFERSLTDPTIGVVVPGGLGDALSQLFGFSVPTYQVGLSIQLPLRNRRAAADLADAAIQKKRNLFQMRSIEQNIRLDVLQAISGVELSKAAVQQATVARDFAEKRLDAEQRKYDLGVSTAFIVLDAQDTLVRAEADLVDQSIAFRRALLTLDRATGELLRKRGVELRYD